MVVYFQDHDGLCYYQYNIAMDAYLYTYKLWLGSGRRNSMLGLNNNKHYTLIYGDQKWASGENGVEFWKISSQLLAHKFWP